MNVDIRTSMGVGVDMIETVEVKLLHRFGHLKSMSRQRYSKKVWEWTPLCRRKKEGLDFSGEKLLKAS